MHVEYAQLPPPEDSADRIFITDNAVIVLDGASAFVPVPVSAQIYANELGQRLAETLALSDRIDLREALASAIQGTAIHLNLIPRASPSSTVSILREGPDTYDLLVLGDSPIIWGNDTEVHTLSDTRIDQLDLPERHRYQSRLRAGYGYDAEHRECLRALQTRQAELRNTTAGYWIAEAQPDATHHAMTISVPRSELAWAVLMTDGVSEPLEHHQRDDWPCITGYNSADLDDLLHCVQSWEHNHDPNGQQLPRAKRHDDKTIAVLRSTLPS